MEIPELIKAGQAFRGESDQYAELITELADALAATVAEMHKRELHHFEVEQDNAKVQAQALRDAADFRVGHDLDHDYWNRIAKLYQAGGNMVTVWLRYRADQIERGETP